MTTTLWERRIAHIDRRVGPLEWRSVRGALRKAAVKKRRGLPSRDLPVELTFEMLDMELAIRRGDAPDPDVVARIQWRLIRERLLERKREKLRATRRRARPSVSETKINLWRRRRDWLREVERTRGRGV